jgi:DNA-binding MarR family transcriptional regulator
MFINEELAKDENLTNNQKILLARIMAEISINGYCDITTKELADELSSGKEIIRKSLKKLEQNNYIKIDKIKEPGKIKRLISITDNYKKWIL